MLVGDDAANNDVVSQAFLWERRQARDAKSSRATTGGRMEECRACVWTPWKVQPNTDTRV